MHVLRQKPLIEELRERKSTMQNISLQEIMEKAKTANSPEELLALAKENDYPLSEEDANACFERMNKTGELSDSELDSVSGGACYRDDKRMVINLMHSCPHYVCQDCGKGKNYCTHHGGVYKFCGKCIYEEYVSPVWVCNCPENYGK